MESAQNQGQGAIHPPLGEALDGWVEEAGVDPESLAAPEILENQRGQVIDELQRMNNPALADLIAGMEAANDTGAMASQEQLPRILDWLDEIGIGWEEGPVPEGTFLPGIQVVAGRIIMDRATLLSAGDILHEAGHIALLPAEKRSSFNGNLAETVPEHKGDEIAVILWTFAAAKHLGLRLQDIIHDQGFKGDAEWLREEFTSGNYIGLPLLVWMGLCDHPKTAGEAGFPKMKRWLR